MEEYPDGKAQAITALIIGILSLLGLLSPIVGIVCGIIAIVNAYSSNKKRAALEMKKDGRAIAGMVLGILGLVIGFTMWIINMVELYDEQVEEAASMLLLYLI